MIPVPDWMSYEKICTLPRAVPLFLQASLFASLVPFTHSFCFPTSQYYLALVFTLQIRRCHGSQYPPWSRAVQKRTKYACSENCWDFHVRLSVFLLCYMYYSFLPRAPKQTIDIAGPVPIPSLTRYSSLPSPTHLLTIASIFHPNSSFIA